MVFIILLNSKLLVIQLSALLGPIKPILLPVLRVDLHDSDVYYLGWANRPICVTK